MKLLVTGGTGFLGTHLVPRLVAAGHEVRIIGRSKPMGPGFDKVEYVRGDLKDREAVRRALEGVEAVYHLAGLVSFQDKDARRMYELHVDSTRELLRDVREAGVKRVILASTSGTIAVSKEERVGTEDDGYPIEVVGRWPYYLSKIYEEKLALEYCRQHAIPLVVLNPSLLMGPGDDRLSSTWTVMKFLQGELPAMPGGGMSFVDARDAADAFVNALTRGEVYGRHLLGVNMSMPDFFERLERLSGVKAPRLKLPPKVNVLGAKVLEQVAKWRGMKPTLDPQEVDIGEHWFWLDSSKAERELGFKARDVHETLHDTVQYLYTRMAPGHLPGTKGKLEELREGT
ncbi:NAD-dependent epimerase/dehydratase family protein [Archangium lansingense]|uniref:NAD-dependent epimerase/dehydratase family protein n=1 Tax=Archangium lansingense TaxID=2995310 RepID=A0ABT4A197_9BACT|nr:NAD-dependent epimerase/dehydratase family protein [Archangium lansinium]MCY1075405.1 NAD-dependent epimerase/dehydratase family protein [Archangium lansinium]